jgi:hypothetical protein
MGGTRRLKCNCNYVLFCWKIIIVINLLLWSPTLVVWNNICYPRRHHDAFSFSLKKNTVYVGKQLWFLYTQVYHATQSFLSRLFKNVFGIWFSYKIRVISILPQQSGELKISYFLDWGGGRKYDVSARIWIGSQESWILDLATGKLDFTSGALLLGWHKVGSWWKDSKIPFTSNTQ